MMPGETKYVLCPHTPRVSLWRILCLASWNSWRILSWNFLRTLCLEIDERKSERCFATFFAHVGEALSGFCGKSALEFFKDSVTQVSPGRKTFRKYILKPRNFGAKLVTQQAPDPPEFAQPRLSRVKGRSSPARGYELGVFVPIWPVSSHTNIMTGHIGTNTPKPYSNGAVQIRMGLELN